MEDEPERLQGLREDVFDSGQEMAGPRKPRGKGGAMSLMSSGQWRCCACVFWQNKTLNALTPGIVDHGLCRRFPQPVLTAQDDRCGEFSRCFEGAMLEGEKENHERQKIEAYLRRYLESGKRGRKGGAR